MDCCLLSSSLLPHVIINSRRSFTGWHGLGSGVNSKGWLRITSHAVSQDGIGGPEFSEGSSKGEANGSIFSGLDVSFETLNAEITQETVDFFVSDAEGDPDCPSEGYSSIDQAINALRQGKFVIAVDDENGNHEGDLIMAATLATPQAIAFMIRHGSGIVSVGMKEEDLERLRIPMMSPITEIADLSTRASTVTVDAREGTSTGVSAADRAKTILALSSPDSKPGDLRRPGHVFPLKYRNGGILERAGHTEASVDLVTLAGLRPVAVLSTIVDPEDGSMASLSALKKMAEDYGLPIVSITDLIRYRRKREKLVEKIAVSRLPTKWGLFQAYCYRSKLDGTEHIAVVKILRDIGVRTMRLMTNNPAKFIGLKGYGLAVIGRVPVISPITEENKRYLETKRTKMGHVYGSDLPADLPGFLNPDAGSRDASEQ